MPLPQKRWFRMVDVAERWSIKPTDVEDYALDEMLQLSVFVVDLPAEYGSWEGSRVGEGASLQDLPILNGPQSLLRSSLLDVFRGGQAEVRAFRTERPNTYLHIRSDVPSMVVRRDDLIVTREERDRFECEHGAVSAPDGLPVAEFAHNEDCQCRSKNASAGRSKSASRLTARRRPLGAFLRSRSCLGWVVG